MLMQVTATSSGNEANQACCARTLNDDARLGSASSSSECDEMSRRR